MSSTTRTTATTTDTATTVAESQTFWCHECDMSVTLVVSSSSSSSQPLLCPHCDSDDLEQMESSNPDLPNPIFGSNFDLLFSIIPDFSFDCGDVDDDGDDDSVTNTMKSSMKSVEISDSLLAESCPICIDVFGVGSEAKQLLPCNHVYHSDCIITWLSNHPSCPLCRVSIIDSPEIIN